MIDDLTLALVAGMLAAVNPCGFAIDAAAGVRGVLSDWLEVIGPVPLVVALVLLTATSALLSRLRRADRPGMGRWGRNR